MVKEYKQAVRIPYEEAWLEGELAIPKEATGIVLFAHGSGSSRFSPRNQFVANYLYKNKLGTLLIDLLTAEEEKIDLATREFRFDIDLLTRRLLVITDWLITDEETKPLRIGYFGSSTGAAGALMAAAQMGSIIGAVVSRGGRPDLAGLDLPKIVSPTLFLVGGNDPVVIELNQQAYEQLVCKKAFEIIPGATHLFEEPGTLEKVAELACQWFQENLI